jgi:hypothetical protein
MTFLSLYFLQHGHSKGMALSIKRFLGRHSEMEVAVFAEKKSGWINFLEFNTHRMR